MGQTTYDFIFLGGGLASSLVVWRLTETHPQLRCLILEKGLSLGGNHTWSFHTGDVSREALDWLRPVIKKSWNEHSVVFTKFRRTLRSGYHSINSLDFHDYLSKKLSNKIRFSSKVASFTDGCAVLADGEKMYAGLVIDARGTSVSGGACGYQKFAGIDVSLHSPHGLSGPVLMDATVTQSDGYRFMYCLPWSSDSLLVEDTYYSDTPNINESHCRLEIMNYIERRGWKVRQVTRSEVGCLPIPFDSSIPFRQSAIGVGNQFFHATTGYSLPFAVELAEKLGKVVRLTPDTFKECISSFYKQAKRRNRFFCFLNRMLFLGAIANQRVRIFERFYSLPQKLVERFYAGRLSWVDKARILVGRPPIPVKKAIQCFNSKGAFAYG